ncbi:hypothetical protein C8J57DRAFT_1274456 [Mycena rebaudengoi]|nr:hypothetical protein C8J57DRAFT_1274456 [Mycena rebaudengoi]
MASSELLALMPILHAAPPHSPHVASQNEYPETVDPRNDYPDTPCAANTAARLLSFTRQVRLLPRLLSSALEHASSASGIVIHQAAESGSACPFDMSAAGNSGHAGAGGVHEFCRGATRVKAWIARAGDENDGDDDGAVPGGG